MERRQFIAGSAIAALSVSALPIAAAYATADRSEWAASLRAYNKSFDGPGCYISDGGNCGTA